MKILLLQPFPYKRLRRRIVSNRLPLGLLYIGETVRLLSNTTVEFLDLSLKSSTFNFEEYLLNSSPDIIGVSVHSTAISSLAFQITYFIKNTLQNCIVVGGGTHVSFDPINSLKNSDFDIIVRGEGEIVFTNLVNTLKTGGNLESVKGIIFKNETFYLDTGYGEFPNIELLPNIPPSFLNIDDYELNDEFLPGGKTINLVSSRGCPYKCAFCSYKTISGTQTRFRSAHTIFSEIERLLSLYKIHNFNFVDDNFISNISRNNDLFDLIISNDLKICFRFQARADSFLNDINLVKKITRAGCKHISFGIESGDQELLDRMNKKLNLKDCEKAIMLAKDFGISVRLFLMVGLPYQDYVSIHKTIDFLKRTKPDNVSVNLFVPYPGSPIYSNLEKWGITISTPELSKHYNRLDWFDYNIDNEVHSVIETKWMNYCEIEKSKKLIEEAAYDLKKKYNQ